MLFRRRLTRQTEEAAQCRIVIARKPNRAIGNVLVLARKPTKGDAWIDDCRGPVVHKAETKSKRDEPHHHVVGSVKGGE